MKPSLYETLALDRERAHRAVLAAERREHALTHLRCKLAGLQLDLAAPKLWRALRRNYRPDQPRVPAGQPGGGQWTEGGGGGSGRNDPRVISDATPENDWKPGAQYAQNTEDRRYAVDLEKEDKRGGHGFEDHVGKTDAELVDKMERERRNFWIIETGIWRNGTFFSPGEANEYVERTLEANRDIVDDVAAGRRDKAFVKHRFGFVTGREAIWRYGERAPTFRRTYGVGVDIRHDERSPRGFRVHTAYPRNDDE